MVGAVFQKGCTLKGSRNHCHPEGMEDLPYVWGTSLFSCLVFVLAVLAQKFVVSLKSLNSMEGERGL